MTTCLALICDQSRTIFGAADTQFSLDYTTSNTAEKIQLLDQRWYVLYAGNVSPCEQALLSLQDQFAEHPHTIAQVRAALIVACQSWPCQMDEDRYLLVAGFDHRRRPHLLVAYDAVGYPVPSITSHGRRGVAAIGSGAAAAEQYLAHYRCNRRTPRIEGAYLACAAKFFSEPATGVGVETHVIGLRYDDIAQLPLEVIDGFRTVYEQQGKLPAFPTAPVGEIGKKYQYFG
ncbi:MAG: hypothetical protein HYU53_17030 [Acidobacteria bacterium]|nr:hypothetical protein [Acidobacteriota bacterium]